MTTVDDLRARLIGGGLAEADLAADPVDQFRAWFSVAEEAGVFEPSAMTLATADATGEPNARVVLLRGVDERGFVWFTDRSSAKGRQLAENPRAALVIAWVPLGRQVRVTGGVEPTTEAESDAYWATRPRGSQLAACTSHQSTELAGRDELEARYAELEAEYEGRDVPRPERWGGFRLRPERIEFWQQREWRAHDRFRYQRTGDTWRITRLSP